MNPSSHEVNQHPQIHFFYSTMCKTSIQMPKAKKAYSISLPYPAIQPQPFPPNLPIHTKVSGVFFLQRMNACAFSGGPYFLLLPLLESVSKQARRQAVRPTKTKRGNTLMDQHRRWRKERNPRQPTNPPYFLTGQRQGPHLRHPHH